MERRSAQHRKRRVHVLLKGAEDEKGKQHGSRTAICAERPAGIGSCFGFLSGRLYPELEQRFTQVQFLRQESGFLHNSFEWGYLIYESVKKNDKQELARLLNGEKPFRYGVLSKEKLRSAKDLVICLISAIIQFAMLDRIVESELAFTAADVCIQLIEEAATVNDVICHAHASLYKLGDFIAEYRQRTYHPIVQQAKEYIHQHAHEPIRTGQLAQALGISREYLSRTFKAVEGISLRAYIRDSKIKTAEKLLRHSERSILDISRYLGFSSQSHFTESFKAETGTTPQEYRRIFRET